MKPIHISIILSSLLFVLTGCNKLTDVLNTPPPHNLVPENVAHNAEGVRNLLNGAYAVLHNQYYYMHTEAIPAVMGGTLTKDGFFPSIEFEDNALTPQTTDVNYMWQAFYEMINQSNWVIQLANELPAGELSEREKQEILGQARGLRAMAHFDALRYYGQFYDLESVYGIIVQTEPANYTTRARPRNTVAESYQSIMADLDFAVENAPDFTTPIYFSKTAAKALKARVLLYQGKYTEAAALADEVIQDPSRALSPTFAEVFSTGFNSSEMIFMRATDAITATLDRKRFTYRNGSVIASSWLQSTLAGDPRQAVTYDAATNGILKVDDVAHYNPTYMVRLAEVYLIRAEGLARSQAPLADAKEPLEAIRSRAYGTPQASTASTYPELLNEIYLEIIRELSIENGQDWFASIRFEKLMEVKPSVTSSNQFIMPIPEAEINSNLSFGPQNPGYE